MVTAQTPIRVRASKLTGSLTRNTLWPSSQASEHNSLTCRSGPRLASWWPSLIASKSQSNRSVCLECKRRPVVANKFERFLFDLSRADRARPREWSSRQSTGAPRSRRWQEMSNLQVGARNSLGLAVDKRGVLANYDQQKKPLARQATGASDAIASDKLGREGLQICLPPPL